MPVTASPVWRCQESWTSPPPELDRALRGAQDSAGLVTLDLRRLTFMDCRGLSILMSAAARARTSGDRFRVVRGPPTVDRLFELVGSDLGLDFV